MNKKRCVLENYIEDAKHGGRIELYLGNKIVQGIHEEDIFYDLSLVKDIFGVIKKGIEVRDIFSISDFSNFQKIHKPQYTIGGNFNTCNTTTDIVARYSNLRLFTPLSTYTYYVTHLRPLWNYIRSNDALEIKAFLDKYNEKNLPLISQKIDKDRLQLTDWWYCSDEFTSKEDYIDIVSTTPDNLSAALGVVYDGGYSKEKCLKKSR